MTAPSDEDSCRQRLANRAVPHMSQSPVSMPIDTLEARSWSRPRLTQGPLRLDEGFELLWGGGRPFVLPNAKLFHCLAHCAVVFSLGVLVLYQVLMVLKSTKATSLILPTGIIKSQIS